jgi:hypothetical protein
MKRWVLIVPAWGDRCVGCFINHGLPAIRAAMTRAKLPVTFQIYTDQQQVLTDALKGLDYRFYPNKLPLADFGDHRMLGLIHGQAMRNAKVGTVLAILNADHVPSIEAFEAVEKRLAQGKRLVMCAGLRTTSENGPPIGETSRALLQWEWEHPHIQTANCIWGAGRSDQPSLLIFVNGKNVVAHAFHLHPFAVAIDGRDLSFEGVTIDDDIALKFKREEVHIVTDADEMALAEMSPPEPERWRLLPNPLMIKHVARWGRKRFASGRPIVNPMHKWFFEHGIRIVGYEDANEHERVAEILAAMPVMKWPIPANERSY